MCMPRPRQTVTLEDMFGRLRKKADLAMRSNSARSAAEGTYEAVRQKVVAAQPKSPAEVERLTLEGLAAHRGWTRLSDSEFQCSFGGRTSKIPVPVPFSAGAFFRAVTRAEVNVYLGDSSEFMLRELHMIAQRELQRLLDRDAGT